MDGPETKLARLQSLMAAGDFKAALKLAASFPRLGDHDDAIRRGWAAASQSANYRQMGYDVDALIAAGVAAIRERWKIEA